MTKASDILFQAADLYEKQGTHRFSLHGSNDKCCTLGIIAKAAVGDPEQGYRVRDGIHGANGRLACQELTKVINESEYVTESGQVIYSPGIVDFNDRARTKDGRLLNARTIAGKMRKAARRLARRGK